MTVLALALSSVCSVAATDAPGVVTGQVLAPDGIARPNLVLVLWSEDTPTTRMQSTNASGRFSFAGVEPGRYVLEADSGDYVVPISHDAIVEAGDVLDLCIDLPSPINYDVYVVEESPIIAVGGGGCAAHYCRLDCRNGYKIAVGGRIWCTTSYGTH